jgi:serine/threonine-protein kinase
VKIRNELHKMGLTVRSVSQIALERGLITEEQNKQIRQQMMEQGVYPRLGGYEVVAKIASGGMGTVYKARQLSLDREVAIKVLPKELAGDLNYVKRFQREAKLAAKISHPNAVHIYDVGYEGGKHYIAMEYVPGVTAKDLLEDGPIEEGRALDIVRQVAAALAEAHLNKIIHRDIKPGNILLTKDGVAKLADLGLAKDIGASSGQSLTMSGIVSGTPTYMAPEQCAGDKDVDHRADIYSLGITLYRMLVGRDPFEASTPVAVMRMHLEDPLPDPRAENPAVSAGTAQLITDMTAKDRAARVQTCDEVMRRIDEIRGRPAGTSGFAVPTSEQATMPIGGSALGPVSKKVRLRRLKALVRPAVLGPIVAILLGAGIAVGYYLAVNKGKSGGPVTPEPAGEPAAEPKPVTGAETPLSPEAKALIIAARDYENQNQPLKAMEALAKAWKADPENPAVIAETLRMRKKFRTALLERQGKESCELTVRAYIGGASALRVLDGTVQWYQFRGELPGKQGGNDYPTYINGEAWSPTWRDFKEDIIKVQKISNVFPCASLLVPPMRPEVTLVEWKGSEKKEPPAVTVDVKPEGIFIVFKHDGADAAWYEARVSITRGKGLGRPGHPPWRPGQPK